MCGGLAGDACHARERGHVMRCGALLKRIQQTGRDHAVREGASRVARILGEGRGPCDLLLRALRFGLCCEFVSFEVG